MEAEKKYKLSLEVAQEHMARFLESYNMDPKDLEIDNGVEWVNGVLNNLIRAIRRGNLEVGDNGTVKLTLGKPKEGGLTELTFARVNGNAMHSRDKVKGGQFEKTLAFMGALANVDSATLRGLDYNDLSIIERLAQLFMVL